MARPDGIDGVVVAWNRTHASNDPVYNPDIPINAPIDINSMADGFGQVGDR